MITLFGFPLFYTIFIHLWQVAGLCAAFVQGLNHKTQDIQSALYFLNTVTCSLGLSEKAIYSK